MSDIDIKALLNSYFNDTNVVDFIAKVCISANDDLSASKILFFHGKPFSGKSSFCYLFRTFGFEKVKFFDNCTEFVTYTKQFNELLSMESQLMHSGVMGFDYAKFKKLKFNLQITDISKKPKVFIILDEYVSDNFINYTKECKDIISIINFPNIFTYRKDFDISKYIDAFKKYIFELKKTTLTKVTEPESIHIYTNEVFSKYDTIFETLSKMSRSELKLYCCENNLNFNDYRFIK